MRWPARAISSASFPPAPASRSATSFRRWSGHAALDHLTVVISPLVALMADQREGLLRKHGVDTCVVVNGSLSPLHRQDAIEQVTYGDASMLLIAPEQLRNAQIRQALDARRIGLWVFDEAHCISTVGA